MAALALRPAARGPLTGGCFLRRGEGRQTLEGVRVVWGQVQVCPGPEARILEHLEVMGWGVGGGLYQGW